MIPSHTQKVIQLGDTEIVCYLDLDGACWFTLGGTHVELCNPFTF